MTTFNEGDKVVRRRSIPYEYWVKWEEVCGRLGLHPLSPVTITRIYGGAIYLKETGGISWRLSYFTKDHEFSNKTLEDYL